MAYKKYTIILSMLTVTGLALVLLFNSIIDTLWYFEGNKLFDENYSFNERFAKVNQYLINAKQYNCIIFGSSRVTLLDANKIEGYKCFNFSFSDGTPEEFIYYAKYIKKYGRLPEKLIIGIDARYYSRKDSQPNVPEFVTALETPPIFIKPYLSFGVLDFSIRTLQRKPPRLRYYNAKLIGDLLPYAPHYTPPECFTPDGFGRPYTSKNIHYISRLKTILQAKSVVGYVAPISAWDMLPLMEDGEIDSYIKLIYSLSKEFEAFYDFSLPSSFTKRTDNNYDGHHFTRAANNEIAHIINGYKSEFGLPLHKLSYEAYKHRFKTAMLEFVSEAGKRKKSAWSCPHRSAVR